MWEDLIAGMPSGGDLSSFEMPTGQDWMSNFNFSGGFPAFDPASLLSTPSGGWDPPTGWPGNVYGAGGFMGPTAPGGGGGSWLPNMPSNAMDWMKAAGWLGKEGFGAWQGIDRMKQLDDYNKAVQDYYKQQGEYTKQQQEYLKQKQAWEAGFVEQFGGAQEEFGAATAEYQGQLSAASEKANDVMGQYLAAAKPLLAQSQELLVPGVAALAKGQVPEQWEPILNEARLRGTTAMVQSMVSAGMSPDAARAAAQPVAEQQAQTLLLQLATNMITQGGQLSQVGMTGLGGAGALTEVMGKLAAMGMDAETREFQIMAGVLGQILGQPVQGTTMQPPMPPAK